MAKRGRPASKKPRQRRIETRINTSTDMELDFICKETGLSKTTVIDKAIHLVCLLISDSRSRDETLYSMENITANRKAAQAQWDGLFDVLSSLKYRLPSIDETKLQFICYDSNFETYEEALSAVVNYEYLKAERKYTAEEMELWHKEARGQMQQPNDVGILEDFERVNF